MTADKARARAVVAVIAITSGPLPTYGTPNRSNRLRYVVMPGRQNICGTTDIEVPRRHDPPLPVPTTSDGAA
ncbi:hypothetical protein, partial [Rhodococcus sp. BS-15]|uniref:hypothetical protein n=1 Tax=Rhodococcus sp. BS-15 TaxID=1304954 RepID=UPI001F418A4C